MAKIQFKSENCFGCGACWSVAPNNFTCSDDGRTVMISDEPTKEAIEASKICPVSAILVENNCNCSCEECSCGENCNCTEENNCNCSDCQNK